MILRNLTNFSSYEKYEIDPQARLVFPEGDPAYAASKNYDSVAKRIKLGVSTFFKALFTLGFGLSEKDKSNWEVACTGKRRVWVKLDKVLTNRMYADHGDEKEVLSYARLYAKHCKEQGDTGRAIHYFVKAGDYYRAAKLYDLQGDEAKALENYVKVTDSKSAAAEFYAGEIHLNGASKDIQQAKICFENSLEHSSDGKHAQDAHVELAHIIEDAEDLETARDHYEKAVALGKRKDLYVYGDALQSLAYLLEDQPGYEAQVAEYYQKAAEAFAETTGKNKANACYMLASMYKEGFIGQDLEKAEALYDEARGLGATPGISWIEVYADLSRKYSELKEYEKAAKCLEKLSAIPAAWTDSDLNRIEFNVDESYIRIMQGYIEDGDHEKAASYLSCLKHKEKSTVAMKFVMETALASGNWEKAEDSFEILKSLYEDLTDQENLADLYRYMAIRLLKANRDDSKVIDYLNSALNLGSAGAKNDLGYVYEHGFCGMELDAHKSFQLYLEAAEVGFSIAQFNVARCFKDGIGTEQNLLLAKDFFEKAAKQGHEEAQKKLEELPKDSNFLETAVNLTKKASKAVFAAGLVGIAAEGILVGTVALPLIAATAVMGAMPLLYDKTIKQLGSRLHGKTDSLG